MTGGCLLRASDTEDPALRFRALTEHAATYRAWSLEKVPELSSSIERGEVMRE